MSGQLNPGGESWGKYCLAMDMHVQHDGHKLVIAGCKLMDTAQGQEMPVDMCQSVAK